MQARLLLANLGRLLCKRQVRFHFDRIPLTISDISRRKAVNLFRVGWNRLLPIPRALGYPYVAHISPSGRCNLHCQLCPTYDPLGKAKFHLPYPTYKKFIDEVGDYLLYIIMWSWGEPLLNPEFYRMIGYAAEKKIVSVTSSNFNAFSREEAREMLGSGLDALIIALDGITQETYAKFRQGGDADRVIENTRILVEEKKRQAAEKPIINLRMVVSKENEHEVQAFKQLARDIGVDMVSLKAFSTRQSGTADHQVDRKFAPDSPDFRWYRYDSGFTPDMTPKKYACRFPWTKPTLFPDGTIISCEFDFKYDFAFGNINEQSFKDIWFGSFAQRFRKEFLKGRDRFLFCRDCVYDYKVIPGCVLEWEMIEDAK